MPFCSCHLLGWWLVHICTYTPFFLNFKLANCHASAHFWGVTCYSISKTFFLKKKISMKLQRSFNPFIKPSLDLSMGDNDCKTPRCLAIRLQSQYLACVRVYNIYLWGIKWSILSLFCLVHRTESFMIFLVRYFV